MPAPIYNLLTTGVDPKLVTVENHEAAVQDVVDTLYTYTESVEAIASSAVQSSDILSLPVSTATQAALDAKADAGSVILASMYDGNDTLDGATGWNFNNADSSTFDGNGWTITKNIRLADANNLTVFKDVDGAGVYVEAGHRYAIYAEFTLESGADPVVASVEWDPFLQGEAASGPIAGKRLGVGAAGSPVRHKVVTSFVAPSSAQRLNVYATWKSLKDAANQNISDGDLTVVVRTLMMVDCGVDGDATFDLSDAELTTTISSLGAPYHPGPDNSVNLSVNAVSAIKASFADASETSELSDVATLANTVLSSFKDLRLISLGHSLVSLYGWQNYLTEMMDLEGVSFQGIDGGTIQPKPATGTPGMFSREYYQDLKNSTESSKALLNIGDTSNNGIRVDGFPANIKDKTFATLFWDGANDIICDFASVTGANDTLYLDGAYIPSMASRAIALSTGDYADTAAGQTATSGGQYYSVAGAVSGWKILYKHIGAFGGDPAYARMIYHYPESDAVVYDTDRPMTIAEQDEFEARNLADGSNAFLSEPLSNGFVVTYEALEHTKYWNYYDAFGWNEVAGHNIFVVIEPQAFWVYDGTVDHPQALIEKNEVKRRVAHRWSFPIIDLQRDSGYNMATRGLYISNEASGGLQIHQTPIGGKHVASIIASRLKQFPPIDFTGLAGTAMPLPTTAANLSPWDVDNVTLRTD